MQKHVLQCVTVEKHVKKTITETARTKGRAKKETTVRKQKFKLLHQLLSADLNSDVT